MGWGVGLGLRSAWVGAWLRVRKGAGGAGAPTHPCPASPLPCLRVQGRGVGPEKDHIYLHLNHLPPELLAERLPGISETAAIFAGGWESGVGGGMKGCVRCACLRPQPCPAPTPHPTPAFPRLVPQVWTSLRSPSLCCPPCTTTWEASQPTTTVSTAQRLPMVRGMLVCTPVSNSPAHPPTPPHPTPPHPTPAGEVIRPVAGNPDAIVPGLMAAGEAASASVHGANRLGANSLLDIVVFGRACALRTAETLKPGTPHKPLPADAGEATIARLDKLRWVGWGVGRGGQAEALRCRAEPRTGQPAPLPPSMLALPRPTCLAAPHTHRRNANGSLTAAAIRRNMQRVMQNNAAVFRTQETLAEGCDLIDACVESYGDVRLADRGMVWNTDLVEAVELENLLMNAAVTMHSAERRK